MNNQIIMALEVILFTCLFTLGFLSGMLFDVYKNVKDIREYDGLFLDRYNHTEALKTAYTYDKLGAWVCINIDGMSYGRAVEVCQHEVGHEIFAEVCEENMTKCLGVVNGT